MSAEIREQDHHTIAASLQRMALMRPGDPLFVEPLAGGVSCDVWRVRAGDGPDMVVKCALPKLRVTADWRAPAERSGTEVDWFQLVAGIDPRLVPEVLGEDRPHHIFAMEYLPAETYPVWKSALAAGQVDVDFAARVGTALAHIHAATANREDVMHDFAHQAQFHALRLEPYLLHAAKQNSDVAQRLRILAHSVAEARIALMQGDISPKNILIGPDGPVFLDAETACYGDPAFDLAFCLNHLLLKTVWQPQFTALYLEGFAALSRAYLDNATWEDPEELEARTAALLPALLLARIDGKSPVEYLTRDADKANVRDAAKAMLKRPPVALDDVVAPFEGGLRARL
jgi:aminoglycoside phosphotransferase (APT) family kinase protein